MKIAIVGGRDFNDFNLLNETISAYIKENNIIQPEFISGADSLGEKYAVENQFPITIFKPDWKTFHKAAGIIRNKTIIENSEIVFAFWNNVSKGTKNSIDIAKKLNKKLIIINYEKN